MGMIKIFTGKSKPANKKPGWQKVEADYALWLAKINSTPLFNSGANPKMQKSKKKIDPVVQPKSDVRGVRAEGPSKVTPGGSTGNQYISPEVLYKEAPEMLERELKARERKFNAAPLYNKGGPQFVSDDLMGDIKQGLTRRR